MNTTTLNSPAQPQSGQTLTLHRGYFARRNAIDWVFAAAMVLATVAVFMRYWGSMDIYERYILAGTVPSLIWIGWFWRPLQVLMGGVTALSLLAIWLYQVNGAADLARADQVFL